jgi:peptidoglycan/LPS O-acetylase OafA/YrhL
MLTDSIQAVQTVGPPVSPDESEQLARDSDWAQLNTARFILAYLVVFAHAIQIFLTSTRAIPVRYSEIAGTVAWDAVLCFFVISGLVIGRSLIQRSKRSPDNLFIEFFVRRVARIYPPLLASVVCTSALVAVVKVWVVCGRSSRGFRCAMGRVAIAIQ